MTTTRKFPRTLEEAFGPYQRGPIHEKKQPMDPADKLVIIVCTLISAAMLAMALANWLPGGAA
jgi:hypothetical protein